MNAFESAQLRHAFAHLMAGRTQAAAEVISSLIRMWERGNSGRDRALDGPLPQGAGGVGKTCQTSGGSAGEAELLR